MEKKIVLIDGNSIMNRAFYGVPDLTNKDGLHTNAVYGFLNILFRVIEEEQPTNLLVAFDVKQPTFRHKMYDSYKGTRKPMLPELSQQFPVIKDVLRSMNVTVVEQGGIEADDILGTAAKTAEREGYAVSLVSGDRDLLQLATDKIKIRIPKTKSGKTTVEDYYAQDVLETYHVTPLQIIDLKGLMGDSSDNIPGVPGIGEKTAIKILSQFPSVEEAIANIDKLPKTRTTESLRANTELALLSKELATIKLDCDLGIKMEDTVIEDPYNEKAFEIISNLEFKSILNRFSSSVGSNEEIEKDFVKVTTLEQLHQVMNVLFEAACVGCRVFFNDDHEFLALSLASDKSYFFVPGQYTQEELLASLRELVENETKLVCCDIKAQLDLLPLKDSEQCFDVSVAAYVINPIRNAYGEEGLALEYAGSGMSTFRQLFGKKTCQQAFETQCDEFIKYACYCSHVALCAYEPICEELKKCESEELFYDIEMPLIFTLYDMEQRGIKVNGQALTEYGSALTGRIKELEQKIYDAAGETFNINSPKQLGVILFEKLHMPYAKKTKTGYSTSADILDKLRLEDPIIDEILEYRQLTKLKSTYADGLATYINEDERIHSTFNQTITATGRISSTEPNLQNIPIRMELGRQIRKVFIPRDGFVFLDADYSQIELRVLAHMASDEHLIAAYNENADIHQTTASLVFHTPYDQVTDLQRRNAKAVNFGIVYGISGFGLSRDLNISKKEAEAYIEDYFSTYPKVKEYMDAQVHLGKEQGYVTTMFGRRRPLPELSSGNFMQRQFGERIAMNSPIQGTAADIIKIAMIRVNQRLVREELESQLILQIHDELLVETKISEIERVREIMQTEMEHAANLKVKLVAEVKQGSTWYEAK